MLLLNQSFVLLMSQTLVQRVAVAGIQAAPDELRGGAGPPVIDHIHRAVGHVVGNKTGVAAGAAECPTQC